MQAKRPSGALIPNRLLCPSREPRVLSLETTYGIRFLCSATDASKPKRLPNRYWSDATNIRKRLDEIGSELGIKELSDWYTVNRNDVGSRGGWGLLQRTRSLPKALAIAYPEHNWDKQNFVEATGRAPAGHWQDEANLFKALDDVSAKLGISQLEDWYSVRMTDLIEAGFPKLSRTQLADLLEKRYPNYAWEKVYLLRGKYAHQKQLERTVSSLFSGVELIPNARKEAGVMNPDTGDNLELDIYLPSLHLAFEYQEKHHYTGSDYTYQPVEKLKERDRRKKELVKEKGITLIAVPFWWDGQADSLAATIKTARPDLLTDYAKTDISPIPEEMPEGILDAQIDKIEDIGQPTTACFFTLSSVNPAGWWVFEKYDGVRGFWNPTKKAFYSRKGNKFNFPAEVIDAMPTDMFLDGELWFGRENFSESMKIALRADNASIDWSNFKYMVFDIPTHKGTYQERYKELEGFVTNRPNKFIELAKKEECKDVSHLEQLFQDCIDKGGEGIILRNPQAPFQPGRCPGYLKHKKFRDAEARVIGSVGKQWECELPNGVRFIAPAGTTEFARRWNPQSGDIVSFKHHGFLMATKKPKLPTIYRLRTDLKWEDVLANWKEQKIKPTAPPLIKPKSKKKKRGYWMNIENRRKFFIEFAQEMGFDPFKPENWRDITYAQIIEKKGVGPIVRFSSTLRKTLESTFPELSFNFKEPKAKGNYWKDVNNCRRFFDEFAEEKGFNPLDVESWYSQNLQHVLKKMGGSSIRNHHRGLKKAVQNAYPELKFTKWQLM